MLALLADHRGMLAALWDEVGEYNEKRHARDTLKRVTFYFGQMVTSDEADGGNAKVER